MGRCLPLGDLAWKINIRRRNIKKGKRVENTFSVELMNGMGLQIIEGRKRIGA